MKPIKKFQRETVLVFASITCMSIIIVFTSLANARFDFRRAFSDENMSNAIISAALTIFGTFVSVPAGKSDTKLRVNPDGSPGRYAQEFNEYNTIRDTVEPKRIAFNQWHSEQHLKELNQKRVEYLLSRGILQANDILKLTVDQAKSLTTSQEFTIQNETLYFKALSKKQIKACIKAIDGTVTVHKLSDSYFLYVDGKSSKSFYDQAYYEKRSETAILVGKLAYKIFIGFAIVSVFTGLAIMPNEDLTKTEFIMQAIINITARIFSTITSAFWGWMLGQELAYRECYYINGKTQFLKLFYSDTSFKEIDLQEQAKAEYNLDNGGSSNEHLIETPETNLLA
jgi:hypothetical protein